jgi:hypothetical protein
MELDHARGHLREPEKQTADAGPAAAAVDSRWPGGVMVLLLLIAIGWPLVTLAVALPTYLMADREQAVVLAGVGAASLILRWTLGI